MSVLGYISLIVGAYVLGFISTGYLVARAKDLDVRMVGSSTIGVTNGFRVRSEPAGLFVLLADAKKGFVACSVFF